MQSDPTGSFMTTVRMRQLVSVAILVIAGLTLYTASSWDEWFGPEQPPPAMSSQRAQLLWGRSSRTGADWSATVSAYEALVEAHPDVTMYRFRMAFALHAAGEYERAIEAHRNAMKFPSIRATSHYNLACALALVGRVEESLDELESLERDGFFPRRGADPKSDPDFDSIRTNPRFIDLLDRVDLLKPERQRTRSRVPSSV